MNYRRTVRNLEKAQEAREVAPLVIAGITPDGLLVGGGMYSGREFSCRDVLNWPCTVLFVEPEAVKVYDAGVENMKPKHNIEIIETEEGGIVSREYY